MKKTIIVMPAANEEATMGKVIEEILALPYDNLFLYVIIDNYSKDRTEEIIRDYEEKTGRVKLVFHHASTGVISCYLEGYRRALADGAEQILEMDAGGSHSPAEIPLFLTQLENGYDCVFGSRFVAGGGIANHPLYRRILSSGGTILANAVLGTKLKDMTSGFEAFTRETLEQFDFDQFLSTGHMYQTEMRYYLRGAHSVEVPIHYTGSESGLKWKAVKEALQILFQLKEHEPKVYKQKVAQ